MNAIELLAKQLLESKNVCICGDFEHLKAAVKSLLSLCYPCPDCEGLGKRENRGSCPYCNGTGQSDKRILAVLDCEQKLPDIAEIHGYIDNDTNIAWQSSADEAQDTMISQGWKKTVEEK
jgi:RecJ-like exonuclease